MTILLDNINSALAKAIECLARDPKRAERLLADVKRWVGELAAAQASAAPVAAQEAADARAVCALEHIAAWAGVGDSLKTHQQVRAYAKHNALQARAAIAQQRRGG